MIIVLKKLEKEFFENIKEELVIEFKERNKFTDSKILRYEDSSKKEINKANAIIVLGIDNDNEVSKDYPNIFSYPVGKQESASGTAASIACSLQILSK